MHSIAAWSPPTPRPSATLVSTAPCMLQPRQRGTSHAAPPRAARSDTMHRIAEHAARGAQWGGGATRDVAEPGLLHTASLQRLEEPHRGGHRHGEVFGAVQQKPRLPPPCHASDPDTWPSRLRHSMA
eukprot:360278-Rhodomonas_salina.3